MLEVHLTPQELEAYVSDTLQETARAAAMRHLDACAACRGRVHRVEKLELGLRAVPPVIPPKDLANQIVAAVDWRMSLEEARRKRLPFIALATAASIVVSLWFAFQAFTAFVDDDGLEFLSLYSQRPDLLSTYFFDALFALLESLPLQEIAMTIVAIVIAIVLAQQLVESFRPRAAH